MAAKSKAQADKAQEDQTLTHFETSLRELEALVEELENGDIGLEDSLQKFERGVALARSCQGALKQAELRVAQLSQEDGAERTEPFGEPGAQ